MEGGREGGREGWRDRGRETPTHFLLIDDDVAIDKDVIEQEKLEYKASFVSSLITRAENIVQFTTISCTDWQRG